MFLERNVYVVSLEHNEHAMECEGVWGVFSSDIKAMQAVSQWMDDYDEVMLDYSHDEFSTVWIYYTTKSIWKVERITIDDM